MPRFFIAPTEEQQITITGDDASHIGKSLRMELGDKITLTDGTGWDYHTEITGVTPREVALKLLEKIPNTTEPRVKITLYQALPKGDKFGFIVEKAVELGVNRIVPVLTSRCISRPGEKSMGRKLERFQNTAEQAAKQAGRGIIPQVSELLRFKEALAQGETHDIGLLFYEEGTIPLGELLAPPLEHIKTVGLFIGSEGGFAPEEVEQAKGLGLQIASLGARILRTETAPLAALAAIQFAFGEF